MLLFIIVTLPVTYYPHFTIAQKNGNATDTTARSSGALQKDQNIPAPLFAPCDASIYSTAIYTINGTTTSGKFSNGLRPIQDIIMVITRDNTGGLSGKLSTGNDSQTVA